MKKIPVFTILLFLFFSLSFLCAEEIGLPGKGFTIELTSDWMALPLPLQGVVASYGKKGTLATFHVTERELDEVRRVDQLRWEDLFSPQFASIDIRAQGSATLGGERARYCVYALKPGDFKATMEGKLPAKYINYIVIHGGKLFSITFKDTEEGFALTYPSFLAAVRTLRFNPPVTPTPRKKT